MRQHTAVIALFLFGGVFVLGLLALASTLGPGVSQADNATMHNCPEAGKWSIAAWSGQDAMPIADALAFCPQQVDVAYRIDPDTQAWSRYFRGRPEISNLDTLDNGHGIIALGAGVSAASTAGDESLGATANGMLGCPQPGKWAIAVWGGDDGTPTDQALASCTGLRVTAAYWIDPQTQAWKRHFDGRAEISNLLTLGHMQAIIAVGGAEVSVTPTPTSTPTPTPGPAVNLVPNPSFETGTEEPDGWTHEDPGSSWDTTVSHTGSKSVHVTAEFTECPIPIYRGWVTTEPIFIDKTSTYTVSAWVTIDDTIDAPSAWYASIGFMYFDALGSSLGGHFVGFGPGAPGERNVPPGVWRQVSMAIGPAVRPPDTAYVQVELDGPFVSPCELGGGATAWFDDVYFGSSPP